MGYWYGALFLSLALVFAGLFSHWSLTLAGALLPFVPLLTMLLRRRRNAARRRRN